MKLKNFLSLLSCISISIFLSACSRQPTPDFQHMTLPKTKNYYLVCPQNYCNVMPSAYAAVYPVSAQDLFAAFNQVISEEPRVTFIYNIPEQGLFLLEARSRLFELPDDIAVQFIALSENQSTLIIYARSRYGVYDFGMNERRVDGWLQQLNKAVVEIAAQPMPDETDNEPDPNATQEANLAVTKTLP